MFISVTTQEYAPSSPASVGVITRLLLIKYVYLGGAGATTRPFLCQLTETGPEEVKVQSRVAGPPLAKIMLLGGIVNAVCGEKKL